MTACLVVVHLVAGTMAEPPPAYIRRDMVVLISAVRAPADAMLSRARSYIAFDQRAVYVIETPEAVLRAACETP